jgi:hypothetical protein
MSRIARVRSEDARLENLADPARLGDLDDPRALSRWARQMGSALGDETGEDFGDMMNEMMEAEGQGESGPGDAEV